jgi:multidrug resistance efflux pump
MLNISSQSIKDKVERNELSSLCRVENKKSGKVFRNVILAILSIFFIFCLLPWTQNIRSGGQVTTLKPDQRPNTIHSLIAGKIEKWFVREGDSVRKGDTIMFLSEIKNEYLDPNLVENTGNQIKSKESVVDSYSGKVKALDNQIDALLATAELKVSQARIKLQQSKAKVSADSADYIAAKINNEVAIAQFNRMLELYEDGLKSKTDLEKRRLTLQKSEAEMNAKRNYLLNARSEVINAETEILSIKTKLQDDLAKAESEKYASLSNMYNAELDVTKLQNQYMNYSLRSNMYYVLASQDGYITRAIQSGLGETIKEGDPIVSIMPADFQLAVEMFVEPIDLPLLEVGQLVKIQFDGWPAIVFSGWPNTSYGTYDGRVVAIDNFISDNGKFRVMVRADESEFKWPRELRVGTGSTNLLLLKDVPIWYELWRKINGFPPDYYKKNNKKSDNKDAKK